MGHVFWAWVLINILWNPTQLLYDVWITKLFSLPCFAKARKPLDPRLSGKEKTILIYSHWKWSPSLLYIICVKFFIAFLYNILQNGSDPPCLLPIFEYPFVPLNGFSTYQLSLACPLPSDLTVSHPPSQQSLHQTYLPLFPFPSVLTPDFPTFIFIYSMVYLETQTSRSHIWPNSPRG